GALPDLDEADRRALVADLVRWHAAGVLRLGEQERPADGQNFRDIGYDSLTASELRRRLSAATGVRLASTAAFDHPSVAELAEHLCGELARAGWRVAPGGGSPFGPGPAEECGRASCGG